MRPSMTTLVSGTNFKITHLFPVISFLSRYIATICAYLLYACATRLLQIPRIDHADPNKTGMNLMQAISDAEEYQRDEYYIHCRDSFFIVERYGYSGRICSWTEQ